MPNYDLNTYHRDAMRTVSPEYHHDALDPSAMYGALQLAKQAGEAMKSIKKAYCTGDAVRRAMPEHERKYVNQFRRVPAHTLHGIMGLINEAGELAEILLGVGEGELFAPSTVQEECGDALWFLACALSGLNSTMAGCAAGNIAKLRERYPDKFDPAKMDDANRDKGAELDAMQAAIVDARMDVPAHSPSGNTMSDRVGWSRYKRMTSHALHDAIVHAHQIELADFESAHPNPRHVKGVTYNPKLRNVTFPSGTVVSIGDWLVLHANGDLMPWSHSMFVETFTPMEFQPAEHRINLTPPQPQPELPALQPVHVAKCDDLCDAVRIPDDGNYNARTEPLWLRRRISEPAPGTWYVYQGHDHPVLQLPETEFKQQYAIVVK